MLALHVQHAGFDPSLKEVIKEMVQQLKALVFAKDNLHEHLEDMWYMNIHTHK